MFLDDDMAAAPASDDAMAHEGMEEKTEEMPKEGMDTEESAM